MAVSRGVGALAAFARSTVALRYSASWAGPLLQFLVFKAFATRLGVSPAWRLRIVGSQGSQERGPLMAPCPPVPALEAA